MKPALYSEVEIVADDPAQRLQAGQRGYLVDWAPHPRGGEDGAVIELFDRPDDPVVIVPGSDIRGVAEPAAAPGQKGRAV